MILALAVYNSMVKQKSNIKGFTLIEIILLSAILIIIASFVFRIIYAKEMNEWENNFWISMGIEPLIARSAVGVIAIIAFVWINLKRKKSRKRNRLLD